MANENINPIAENSSGGDSNNKKFVSILTDNSTGTAQDYYIKDLDAQVQLTTKLEKPENIEVTELGESRSNNKLIPGRTYIVKYGSYKVVLKALAGNVLDESGKLIVGNKEYDVKYHIELISKDEAEADNTKFNGYLTGSETGDYGGFIYWLRDPETGNEAPWDWVTTSESPFDDDSNNIIIKPYIVDNKYTKPTTAILSQVIPSKIEGCNKIIDLNDIYYKPGGKINIGDNDNIDIGFHVNKSGIEDSGGRVSIYLPNGDNNGDPLFNFGYNEDKEKYFNVHNLDKINFSSSNFTIDSNISFSGTGKAFNCSIPTNFTRGIVGYGGHIYLYNNNTNNKLLVFKVDNGGNTMIGGNLDVGKNGGNIPNVLVFKNVENSGYGLCIGQGKDNTLSICQYKTTSDNLKNNLNNNYYLKINNSNIVLNRDFRIVVDGDGSKNVFTINRLTGDTNIFGNFEIKNNNREEFVKVETSGQITLNIPGTLDNNNNKQKRFTVYAGSAIFNAGYMNDLPQIWTAPECENINLHSKNIGLYSKAIVFGTTATENINICGKNLTINSDTIIINNNNTVLKNNLTLTKPSSDARIKIKLDDGIECQGNPETRSEDYSHLYGGFAAVIPRGKDTTGEKKVNQRWRFYGRADDKNGTPKNFFNIGFFNDRLGVWSGEALEFFNINQGTTTIKDLIVSNTPNFRKGVNLSGSGEVNIINFYNTTDQVAASIGYRSSNILEFKTGTGTNSKTKFSIEGDRVLSNVNLEVSENKSTKLGGTLEVTGNTTLGGTLEVKGSILKESLTVNGNTKLDGTLNVSGNLRVGPTPTDEVKNAKMIYAGGLQTYGNVNVGKNLFVTESIFVTGGSITTENTLTAASLVVSTEKKRDFIKTFIDESDESEDNYKYELIIDGIVTSKGGFFDTSDGRLKTNLSPIKVNLDSLSKLQKVHFDWKDKEKMGSSRQLGMIAQEVQELYPDLISTGEDGTLSLAYDKLGVIALEAIDLLHKENKELKARLEKLESLICGGK